MSGHGSDQEIASVIELVHFSLQGSRAGIPAAQVLPVRSETSQKDVVAVEALVGLVRVQNGMDSKRVLLNLKTGQGTSLIVGVEATADLVRMPSAAIHPLPKLLAARSQLTGLRALGWQQEDSGTDPLVLLFDWCTGDAPIAQT